eukprot:7444730-Karenia_brevis.AAC.1
MEPTSGVPLAEMRKCQDRGGHLRNRDLTSHGSEDMLRKRFKVRWLNGKTLLCQLMGWSGGAFEMHTH